MTMWEALQLCQREGKVRHIGVSNFARKHIEGMLRDPRSVLVAACLSSDEPVVIWDHATYPSIFLT